jgi:hypothetical protein
MDIHSTTPNCYMIQAKNIMFSFYIHNTIYIDMMNSNYEACMHTAKKNLKCRYYALQEL